MHHGAPPLAIGASEGRGGLHGQGVVKRYCCPLLWEAQNAFEEPDLGGRHMQVVTAHDNEIDGTEGQAALQKTQQAQRTRHLAWLRRGSFTTKWGSWRLVRRYRLASKHYAMVLGNQVSW